MCVTDTKHFILPVVILYLFTSEEKNLFRTENFTFNPIVNTKKYTHKTCSKISNWLADQRFDDLKLKGLHHKLTIYDCLLDFAHATDFLSSISTSKKQSLWYDLKEIYIQQRSQWYNWHRCKVRNLNKYCITDYFCYHGVHIIHTCPIYNYWLFYHIQSPIFARDRIYKINANANI